MASRLHSLLGLDNPITCVDNSASMLANASAITDPRSVRPLLADAASFAFANSDDVVTDPPFDVVYSCEAVHHFGGPGHADLARVLAGVARRMRDGGRIVLQKTGDPEDAREDNGGRVHHGVLPSVAGRVRREVVVSSC